MREINKASEANPVESATFLIFGNTGAGKTSLFRTLPGKKFAYVFDQNAMQSLHGDPDIDYLEFLPDILPMAVRSLAKDKGDKELKTRGSDIYQEWEKDFEERLDKNWFEDNGYKWLMFDSLTTFSQMVMDRVLTINGRPGSWPQKDDYGPQINSILNVFRTATSRGLGLYVTGHMEMKQDELTSRIFQTPLVTGQLKVKLPLLFSQIYYAECGGVTGSGQDKTVKYFLQTAPDRTTPLVRNTLKNVDFRQEVTIDFSKPLASQGLGAMLEANSRPPQSKQTASTAVKR